MVALKVLKANKLVFSKFLFRHCRTITWISLIQSFLMDLSTRQWLFCEIILLDMVLENSTPRKIYRYWTYNFVQNGIIMMKFETVWIHILSTIHSCSCCGCRNRGYYRAARRYKISLWVLRNISRVSAANKWNIFSTHEEKFCISKQPCNILFIV